MIRQLQIYNDVYEESPISNISAHTGIKENEEADKAAK